ncbi:hypothetical protein HYU14_01315 [Candidatus Woesearchaeota archaeon]|nr:hypothetical protein [Candidatus Woesearchaeota archaeon]
MAGVIEYIQQLFNRSCEPAGVSTHLTESDSRPSATIDEVVIPPNRFKPSREGNNHHLQSYRSRSQASTSWVDLRGREKFLVLVREYAFGGDENKFEVYDQQVRSAYYTLFGPNGNYEGFTTSLRLKEESQKISKGDIPNRIFDLMARLRETNASDTHFDSPALNPENPTPQELHRLYEIARLILAYPKKLK